MKILQKENPHDPAFKQPNTLSTSGIRIMSSMDEAIPGSKQSRWEEHFADYRRPGHKLCSYVETFIHTDAGIVPVVKPALEREDVWSTFWVRLGVNRYNYTVSPGLYAIGSPNAQSEVLVTANFKLTFDHLRKELASLNAWILVLDTQGINVWCAAGKGTFSTCELVNRIKASGLERVVGHRRVIVPQLGATGVSAWQVKQQSGFRVVYGPIRAKDISTFLNNGKKADGEMRQVSFTLYERFILTPVEIQMVLKPAFLTALVLLVLSGIGPDIFSLKNALTRGGASILGLLTGIFSGALVTPVLLPFIPVRTFALKGIIVGSVTALILLFFTAGMLGGFSEYLAVFLFSVTISSYLAMNFTGATPFTSPSGVEKEMKRYIPVQLATLVLAFGLWMVAAF